ncbi:hypothetical protein [Chamaesiphon minutus]|uniref:Uncharacterized protein n=1 Tax=Chamaesiphon minutus (strain ATCC 27169 / PCC 6605) TaxID=1173020 RepID=K9UP15_CHAP6|nr:hypothetical protein [Chamaesiphon minutus]AFY96565.1 hypothetical protein Cha6605_5708 [Chamaesiphon minutus PCC 6605]
MAFIDDLITAFKNEFETFSPLFDDLSFENMSLSNLDRNISLLKSRAITLLNYKAIALLRNISFNIPVILFVSSTFSIPISNHFFKLLEIGIDEEWRGFIIIKLLEAGIDEEWRGFVSEQKYGWSKLGLPKKQIQNKTMISLIALHWGRLKSWMQLLRILSWVKSQLMYK